MATGNIKQDGYERDSTLSMLSPHANAPPKQRNKRLSPEIFHLTRESRCRARNMTRVAVTLETLLVHSGQPTKYLWMSWCLCRVPKYTPRTTLPSARRKDET